MRDYKYKAWLPEEKEFYGKIITPKTCMCSLNANYKYELLQYTGLEDSKGVEIYEGDIVKLYKSKYEIVYDVDGFYMNDEEGYTYSIAKELEVIGNIYEDKDLLK